MIEKPSVRVSMELSEHATMADILRWRAHYESDRQAYIFLADGESQEASLTYAELDRRARAIAGRLQQLCSKGECALLLYPSSLDYIAAFFGCLYAGVIAAPAYPPRSNRSLYRIQYIIDNSQSKIVLTTSQMMARSKQWLTHAPDLATSQWIATDSISDDDVDLLQETFWTADTLALLQYTSGSTRTPKGVMVSQSNLLHNLAMSHACWKQTTQGIGVSWLPIFHDLGLIAGILYPLYAGFPVILMAPASFLQRPLRWLKAISGYGGTITYAPNFAYELCVRKSSSEQLADLDLSTWQVALNGAEPVRSETIDRFVQAFEPYGFRREVFAPAYGLAEGTLVVTCSSTGTLPVFQAFDSTALKHHYVADPPPDSQDAQIIVGCGQVGSTQKIIIAHAEDMTHCQPDEIGEIWVSGGSVAQGYWRSPEETEQTFRAAVTGTDEGPFLRTGDLGFIRDGELFITGRLKDLIIIRGQNFYPQDIELTAAQSHRALRPDCGTAFSIEVAEDESGIPVYSQERLVIVQELSRHHEEVEDIFAAMRQAVAEVYELEVYAIVLIKQATLPKTSSGKIQRRACREQFLAGELHVIASSILTISPTARPDSSREKRLSRELLRAISREEAYGLLENYFLERFTEVLGGVLQEHPDVAQPLSSFGLDSLKTAQLKNRIEVDLDIDFPTASFFQDVAGYELILEALEHIRQEIGFQKSPALVRVDEDTVDHPLSFNQQQLWFFDQLEPGSSLYTIPVALLLQGPLDVPALEDGLNEIVCRHEALRTTFLRVNDFPAQHIEPFVPMALPIIDLTASNGDRWEQAAWEYAVQVAKIPFNLSTGPLLRVKLLRFAAEKHLLFLAFHHSIFDEWSLKQFFGELSQLYSLALIRPGNDAIGPLTRPANDATASSSAQPGQKERAETELPDLPIRYTDFVHWQRQLMHTDTIEEQLVYWQKQLQGLEPLDLPADYPRPDVQQYQGSQYAFTFPGELARNVKALSWQEGATLFMTLLASFQVFLARYCGLRDIVVGTPSANRTKNDLEGMIGYFVNMLVLRADLSGSPGFKEVLKRVREMCVGAYTHQDLPFLKLVEALHPHRDASRNPLFQVFFTLQADPFRYLSLPGLAITHFDIPTATAKFDLSFSLTDTEHGLTGLVEYNRSIFSEATIEWMVKHWEILLNGIVTDPEQPVFALPLLTIEERQQILYQWNDTARPYPIHPCLHELFEAQAQQTPDAVAVAFEDQQLTYQELDCRANQLAHYLSKLSVQPGAPVGLYLDRSCDMATALLAILKSGGVYLPLDTAHPQRQLAFIIEDTQPPVVITSSTLVTGLPELLNGPHFLCVDSERGILALENTIPPERKMPAGAPAYIIYTSGSTGRPKGVMNTHVALLNRLFWMLEAVSFTADDRVAQKTPFGFDASLWEFFIPWMVGARLVMVRPGGHQDTAYLPSFLQEEAITILQLVPSMLHALLQETHFAACQALRHVFCGGEALSLQTLRRCFDLLPQAQLHNLYGPTEASIDATYWACQPQWSERVPIGRPIANMEIYLLDEEMQPVPIGCVGELYIGGSGLALGYLKQPDLTAERFLPHPLSQKTGVRIYRTGDKARYRSDGLIEYLGRVDQQVKLRGYRIELAEIEAVLHHQAKVRQSVVTLQNDAQGQARLIAYVALHEGMTSSSGELRQYLFEQLPFYMIPAHIIFLESLPRLNNSKIDYKALPTPQDAALKLTIEDEEPYAPTEALVCEFCAQYLNVPKVARHANFFELGGHSLMATQVVNHFREAYQVDIPLHLFLASPTLADFARNIDTIRLAQEITAMPISSAEREEGAL